MPRQATAAGQLAGLASAAVTFFLFRYAGVHVFVPAIAGVLALLLCKKTEVGPRRFHYAISVAFAHLAWFALAAFFSTDAAAAVAVDIAALAAAIAVLWFRPSRVGAMLVAAGVAFFLSINLYMLVGAQVGTLEHKALLVHTLLRVGLLAALWEGVAELKRQAVTMDPTSPTVP